MKIVIYSSNANKFNSEEFLIKTLQKCNNNYINVIKKYTNLQIFLLTKLPCMFIADYKSKGIETFPEEIKGCIEASILRGKTAEEIADEISQLSPDLAIAATFWTESFDWLGVMDSQIAELLSERNIKTVCHPLKTSLLCFNKKDTRDFLLQNGFNIAPSVYVHHELFRAEKGRPEIIVNPYREAILSQIERLHYPVIIKDTIGLSSYGMEVVNTFGEAKNFLCSKKNGSDRLCEEFLEGIQFGTEIHGYKGNYTVYPPFMFSVNKYGITSPKQSVKIGPVTSEKYHLEELNRMLIHLAEKLELKGLAQVDLVFHKEKWYILEINPRLSGLTQTIAESLEKSVPELLLDAAFGKNTRHPEMNYVCSIKYPLVSDEILEKMYKTEGVLCVRQTENKAARQKREEGFCEVIFGGRKKSAELKMDLERQKNNFPDITEEAFYNTALDMIEKLDQ